MQTRPNEISWFIHAQASFLAASLEIASFHPIDTAVKRLQHHRGPVYPTIKSPDFLAYHKTGLASLNRILFKDAATQNIFWKVGSLYPGVLAAGGYKVLQRSTVFTLQPIFEGQLRKRIGEENLGNKAFLISGLSASAVGLTELFLLPLDIMRVRRQTAELNPGAAFKMPALGDLPPIKTISNSLAVTAMRNMLGAFFLFGAPSYVLQNIYGVNKQSATSEQRLGAALAGGILSVLLPSPFDVVKTRVQAINNTETARQIVANMLKEGLYSFTKGLYLRLPAQSLKLTAFMLVQDKIMRSLTAQNTVACEPAPQGYFRLFQPSQLPPQHNEEPANRSSYPLQGRH